VAITTWQAAFRGHYSDGPLLVNTFCVRCDPGGETEQPDAGEIAQGVVDWVGESYIFAQPTSVTVDELAIRELYDNEPRVAAVSLNDTGQITVGTAFPREIVRVMTLRTDVATRRGRGRMFMATPQTAGSLSSAENFVVSGTWFTNLEAFRDDLLAGHDFDYGVGGLASAHLSCRVHSRVGNTDYDVTSILIRQKTHWLRSRSTAP
jgi:hypothetical protein